MGNERITIAIDGPSSAGKSTMAKKIAQHFGLSYIDTGAIYRSVGLFANQRGADLDCDEQVAALLSEIDLKLYHDRNGVQRMLLNGKDVSEDIRMPEVSIFASKVSAMPAVRDFLLDIQREFAKNNDVIMDGRDIGTVVLADARLKIFLTADPAKRAERRYKELSEKGVETTYEQVYSDLVYRDETDKNRAASPLKAAADAIVVDTSECSIEETTERLITIIKEKLA